MSDTPTKRPAKKAAAAPRAQGGPKEADKTDTPIPDEDGVFVIEAKVERFRYLLVGGRILDVESPYRADSNDRGAVLEEAKRRWGGKKDDWKIEGVTRLREQTAEPPTP